MKIHHLCYSVMFNGVSLIYSKLHINDTGLQFHIFDSMYVLLVVLFDRAGFTIVLRWA